MLESCIWYLVFGMGYGVIIKKNKMEKNLTDKQNLILETIREMTDGGQGNPTAYKISKYLQKKGMKVESVKSVTQVIEALEKKELVKRDIFRKIFLVEN